MEWSISSVLGNFEISLIIEFSIAWLEAILAGIPGSLQVNGQKVG